MKWENAYFYFSTFFSKKEAAQRYLRDFVNEKALMLQRHGHRQPYDDALHIGAGGHLRCGT